MSEDVVEIKIRKILLDFLLFNFVAWPNFILSNWSTPYRRGLFCDDDSIRYPVKDGTVKFTWLLAIGFGLNALAMGIMEYMWRKKDKSIIFLGKKYPYWMYEFYHMYGLFSFGDMVLWGITDCIKNVIGRLRPHFFLGCLPNVCLTRYTPNEYYEEFICVNPENKELRLSFPSGHASFFTYSMVYFALYIQSRMSCEKSFLLKHVIQYLAIVAAIVVAMTRISDYKHHWSDVLGGCVLGTTIAFLISIHVAKLFKLRKNEDMKKGKDVDRGEDKEPRMSC
ncbi:unnamed protein product [Psylliodes chrysocephalus]|uniref:Phosphatidic acid phosphatase type 2/haloperoxidase domain-containing protein n=1 Tax=Psylliodes chrysocephalus TaxID=3402493 RepID=A0A9P0D1P1_9CUCU|nr:unnamed protein product [Psylliodes chrysocephala]